MELGSLTTELDLITLKDSSASSTSIKTTPATLPDEVWLFILHEPVLDHTDLTRLGMTCKTLNTVVKDSTLDYKAFKVGATGDTGGVGTHSSVTTGTKVVFHPALHGNVLGVNIILCASHFGEPNRAGLEKFIRWKDHVLSLPLASEYVSRPAGTYWLNSFTPIKSTWRRSYQYRRSTFEKSGGLNGQNLDEAIEESHAYPLNGFRRVEAFEWNGAITARIMSGDTIRLHHMSRTERRSQDDRMAWSHYQRRSSNT